MRVAAKSSAAAIRARLMTCVVANSTLGCCSAVRSCVFARFLARNSANAVEIASAALLSAALRVEEASWGLRAF